MINKGAHYFFSIKGNHRAKRRELVLQFKLKPSKKYTCHNKGHGRVEERTLRVMPIPVHLKIWQGVNQAMEITRKRYQKGKESVEIAYAITSLSAEEATPKQLMGLWRDHWGIENCLHRTRDMAFDEDRSTLRKGSSPQIMAAIRNTAIQVAKKCNLSISMITHLGSRFPKRIIKILQEN